MQRPRTLFISTYPPLHCGIATFTHNLADAVDEATGAPLSRVAVICPKGEDAEFSDRVVYRIDNRHPKAYQKLVKFINGSNFDVVSLQHEYGLFAGQWGIGILELLRHCTKPIVATLHTVLPDPNSRQLEVVSAMGHYCRRLVVMAHVGVELLATRFRIPRSQITYIQHGVPDFELRDRHRVRGELNLNGRRVLMTFGLLSRGKGIEHVVEALPAICRKYPNTQYILVGKTHPAIRRIEGESYRHELCALAKKLGVGDHLRFENRFLEDGELMDWLQACDVYITPYVGRNQITSGTLAYALAAGCAIVSTPYLYAREVLANGRGRLADFLSGHSIGENVLSILDDAQYQKTLEQRAYAYGRQMRWSYVGQMYAQLFNSIGDTESHGAPRLAAGDDYYATAP